MKYEIPIWEKSNLTLEEAAAYSGIGTTKLREISDKKNCGFVLWNGGKRLLKRKKLDEYLEKEFRFGNVQNQGTLNRALRRIMRDCNQEILEQAGKGKKKQSEMVLLPKFSCHSLRHTCATRLCEAGINMKVIQDFLGHADISTTMNIYTDATKGFKAREISRFSDFLAEKMTEAAENA